MRYFEDEKNPLISIIIVNFNGYKWLKKCFSSLSTQSYKNFEIIFVDNASSDKSVDFIRDNYKEVKIIQNIGNLGFAQGNNIGYKHTKGDYILLLNNDTYVEKNYINNFLDAFRKIPQLGVAQSKIILMDKNRLDTCGAFWTDSSFLYYVGNYKNHNLNIYNKPFRVFSVKGASMLIKREVIDTIGLFDEDFWSYYEETDFCHRAWLAGYESWYWPKAVCFHAMGATSRNLDYSVVEFHNFKNKFSSFLKNFELSRLLLIIPEYLVLNILISFAWLLTGKISYSLALNKALFWNVLNVSKSLDKRKRIQKKRVSTDSEIFSKVRKNPSLSYYYYLFKDDLGKYKDNL